MSRIQVLQATGSRSPLFIFPGIGGSLDTFSTFAQQFAAERPVYGLRLVGSMNECEPVRELHKLAPIHAAEIRSLQPHGPYFLFGHAFGAAVAFEVARELLSQGERVGMVAMADSPAPGYPKPPPALTRARVHVRNLVKLTNTARLDYLQARLVHRVKVGKELLGLHEVPGTGPSTSPAQQRAFTALHEAFIHYIPMPLSVGVLFLTADTPPEWPAIEFTDPLMGWGNVLRGRITQCQIPGTHLSILDFGNVEVLAQHVRLAVAQIEHLDGEQSAPTRSEPAYS